MESLFTHEHPAFKFEVFPNRIEVEEGLRGLPKKKRTIPLRNIADVSVVGWTRKLRITTSDGKKHEYNLGLDSEPARDVINDALP